MAKISDPRNKSGDTPRIRGAFLTLAGPDRWHVQAWPKKRGKGGSPGKRYQEMKFARIGNMAANYEPMSTLTAYEMTKGTQQVPRDFLAWCITGRAYEIVDRDGFIWPVRDTMTTNPQYVLDDVSDTVGSLLYRDSNGWLGLDPGNNEYFLQMVNGLPVWSQYAPAPAPPVLVTTLKRTSDTTATSATVHVCSWQAAEIDQNGLWNAATPTRIALPPTTKLWRITVNAIWTGVAVNEVYDIQTRRNDGVTNFFGSMQAQMYGVAATSATKRFTCITPWSHPPSGSYIEIQLVNGSARTVGWLTNSSVTIEVV